MSHIWYYLFAYCVLHGNWVLDGCDDYIICTINWFIQIPFDFRKWLVYKHFLLKDTKKIVKLPWPSRKQSPIFISSNSILAFLTCSILSAETDPLVWVNLVFCKELNKCFLYFFLKRFYSQCWAVCPIHCVGGWNELPSAHYQRVVHSWQHFFH